MISWTKWIIKRTLSIDLTIGVTIGFYVKGNGKRFSSFCRWSWSRGFVTCCGRAQCQQGHPSIVIRLRCFHHPFASESHGGSSITSTFAITTAPPSSSSLTQSFVWKCPTPLCSSHHVLVRLSGLLPGAASSSYEAPPPYFPEVWTDVIPALHRWWPEVEEGRRGVISLTAHRRWSSEAVVEAVPIPGWGGDSRVQVTGGETGTLKPPSYSVHLVFIIRNIHQLVMIKINHIQRNSEK